MTDCAGGASSSAALTLPKQAVNEFASRQCHGGFEAFFKDREAVAAVTNGLLLIGEAVVYFGAMAGLFSMRKRIGVGVFIGALCAMHFLETYLASVFYVEVPFGMVSPGSTVLFSGKLLMLLLLYIKEDAATVRQPIYGLLLGNALMIAMVVMLRFHDLAPIAGGQRPDIAFIDQMGWLMVWGTTLLYLDAIFIILIYERLGRLLQHRLLARLATASCLVLTFDQAGFFLALHYFAGAPFAVFVGGWTAKMCAALLYSAMLVGYLRYFEKERLPSPRGIGDVFDRLTYREKYEALVEHAGRDGLTGLLHRGRFEALGETAVVNSREAGTPLSLLVIDVDHFKRINDRFGHPEGDRVLRAIAASLAEIVHADDRVFRIGGEEFAVLCPYPHPVAKLLGENVRQTVGLITAGGDMRLTVSIGIATTSARTRSLIDLFDTADRRLYTAKTGGRDRVVGEGPSGYGPGRIREMGER